MNPEMLPQPRETPDDEPVVPRAPAQADALMDWLRADLSARSFGAEARARAELEPPPPPPESAPTTVRETPSAFVPIPCPAVVRRHIEIKETYHLGELLILHGDEFLHGAYQALLRRPADPQGLEHYRWAIRLGRLTREEVVVELADSPEGRASGVTVRGLAHVRVAGWLKNLPLVGRLLSALLHGYRLPWVAREMEQAAQDLSFRASELERQQREVAWAAQEATRALDHRIGEAARAGTDALRELEGRAGALREYATGLAGRIAALQARDATTIKWIGAIGEKATELQHSVHALQSQHDRGADHLAKLQRAAEELTALVAAQGSRWRVPDDYYFAFEERFRGSRDDIKSRVGVYVPLVEQARRNAGGGSVLDIGCGRGEWLEVLAEHGVPAEGLDASDAMVHECRQRGLVATHGDALGHLKTVEPNSLAAVTAMHVVEHLPYADLIRLFGEAFRVLRPGGVIVFETPNPENVLVGSCSFWNDPTHTRPLPPEILLHLAEWRGFAGTEVMRLHPYEKWQHLPAEGDAALASRLNELFYGAQDYAVIARKP